MSDFSSSSIQVLHKKPVNGFTLVELMVVIFIIGLSASVVVLNISSDNDVRSDTEKFAARVAAARDHAILQSTPVAMWVAASGYGFEEYREGEWRVSNDNIWDTQNWSNGVNIRTGTDNNIRVIFDSTGLPNDGFGLVLTRDGTQQSIQLDATGSVTIGR